MTENLKSARSAKIGKVFKVARKELGLTKVEVSNSAFMNIRYINVEVKLGWLSKQKKMLEYIEENLP